MKFPIRSFVFFSVVAISLLVYGEAAMSIIEDYELLEGPEEEFNYFDGDERGPSNWGNLRRDWRTCKTGKKQSPIDITFENVEFMNSAGQVMERYKPANATIENGGHDIVVRWPGNKAGSLTIDGRRYFLQQCHWHSPSEHTINGERFHLELHVVHKNPTNNQIAVFSILYNIGRADSFLSKLLPYIKSLKDQTTTSRAEIMGLDPNRIGVDPKIFYRYNGSLTTPPCSENVIWSIDPQIRSVSLQQFYTLKAAVHHKSNARPLQALNRRAIKLFYPVTKQEEYASY